MNKDLNKCPKCGSLSKTILYSTTTLVGYAAMSYDSNGDLVLGTNPNVTTNQYRCNECGETYSAKQQ
jgi:DNA-directed RNA polymerase subunit RPC12/RpoP